MFNVEKFFDKNATMDKINDMFTNALAQTKISELLKKEEPKPKKTNPAIIVLAVVGIAAIVAGIAYAVYRFMNPDYLEDFDDEEEEEEDAEA